MPCLLLGQGRFLHLGTLPQTPSQGPFGPYSSPSDSSAPDLEVWRRWFLEDHHGWGPREDTHPAHGAGKNVRSHTMLVK